MACCTSTLSLGCVGSCSTVETGITATQTGTFTVLKVPGGGLFTFSGTSGSELTFDADNFNEDGLTTFQIKNPDGTLVTSGTNDCFTVSLFIEALTDGTTPACEATTTEVTVDMMMIAYNGKDTNGGTDQQIGLTWSSDGVIWTKDASNPILTFGAGGAQDDSHLAHPAVLDAEGRLWLYYSGYNGSNYAIMLATSEDFGVTWTKYGTVLSPGSGFESISALGPQILYDGTFHLWYSGYNGSTYAVGYASSSDGFSFTKYAGNPVFDVGTAGSWDDAWVIATEVYKESGTYYMYYEAGPDLTFNESQVGVATFSSPTGTYTRSANNPILTPRNSASQSLTVNLSAGTKTVTVADTSVFQPLEYVFIDDDNSTEELNRIVSIDSATQLTLRDNVTGTFTTGQNALIVSIFWGKVAVTSIYKKGGSDYRFYGTAYTALPALQRELSFIGLSTAPDSGFNYDYTSGLVSEILTGSGWDDTSMENPARIINNLTGDPT